MRNGDSYKIKHLAQQGIAEADICHAFRNKYDADEVKRFIPASPEPDPVSVADTPTPKRKARKRTVAKG